MLYSRDLFQWLEPMLLLLLGLSLLLRPGWLSPLAQRGLDVVQFLVARPWRAGLLVFFATGLGAALVAVPVGLPVARVSDETSYLLAADTFAHGRIAMPTPPSPAHFETFFVLVRPVYAAKYPPGQGLMLAAGQVLGGHPAVALWLGAGAFCGAVFWALSGWLPARWAFVGAGIAALRFGVAGYWSHSYWGGTVAALGGALVWGATARILWGDEPRWRDSLLLGFGVALLANTRPLEGLVVSLPAAFLLVRWVIATPRPSWRAVARAAAPTAGVLAAAALAMAGYNARLTGDPLQLPYQLWEEQYASVPIFAGQPVRQLDERPLQIRRFFDALSTQYDPAARWIGAPAALWRLGFLVEFFLGPALAGAVLIVLASRSRPGENLFRMATPTLVVLLLAAVHVVVRPWWPHYTAPAAVLLLLLALAGLRRVGSWRWPGSGAPVGQTLVAGILVIQVLMVGPQLVERLMEREFWSHRRAAIHAELAASAEPVVIFVRYGANHHPAIEWVWNGADLVTAPVLWAHDLGPEKNRSLLETLPGRRAWLLEVDVPGRAPEPVPYALP